MIANLQSHYGFSRMPFTASVPVPALFASAAHRGAADRQAFDLPEFGQTSKWEGDQLIVISAFFDAALQARQLGLA